MKLSIAEGLYLIALDDEEGRLLSAAEKNIIYGLIAAAILELTILGKVQLTGGTIKVIDLVGTGNGIIDKILKKLHSGQQIADEVNNLHHDFKDIQVDMDELLVQRGILQREETKLLWIPLSERMDNANYAFEQEIRNVLHAIVFKNAKPTPSFVILMELIYDCHILDEVFQDSDDLIDAVKVAKDLVKSSAIDDEMQTALVQLRQFFTKELPQ